MIFFVFHWMFVFFIYFSELHKEFSWSLLSSKTIFIDWSFFYSSIVLSKNKWK